MDIKRLDLIVNDAFPPVPENSDPHELRLSGPWTEGEKLFSLRLESRTGQLKTSPSAFREMAQLFLRSIGYVVFKPSELALLVPPPPPVEKKRRRGVNK